MEDDLVNSATPELSNLTQTVLRDLANDDADIADVSVMIQPVVETETVVTLQVIPGTDLSALIFILHLLFTAIIDTQSGLCSHSFEVFIPNLILADVPTLC